MMRVLEVPTRVGILSDIAARKIGEHQSYWCLFNVRDETQPVTENTAISIRQKGNLSRYLRIQILAVCRVKTNATCFPESEEEK